VDNLIFFKVKGKIISKKIMEIMYCNSEGNYCWLYFSDLSKILITKKIKEIEQTLNNKFFQRVSRYQIVNVFYIQEIILENKCQIILKDSQKIDVSHRYKSILINQLKENHILLN